MERRLRKIRPGLRVLLSPGLIEDRARDEAPATSAASPPYALVVARLIEDKNVTAVPEAIAIARESAPDLRCTIVGSGPERERLDELISRLDLNHFVTVTPSLSEAHLTEAMAGAACLLHPSRREGYGLVVVEASRHGTPAVVVQAPDNAALELVEEGTNGFRAPSADPANLGAGVLRCLTGGQSLRESTRQWYEHARCDRSVHRTADKILDFIIAELARRPPQPSA
jgi:glycosyltransferase involved in cell wall biosynthesis